MLAALDALAIALYVEIDDFLEPRRGPGRRPKLSDAELITLAVCQVFLGLPNDRQFLALARYRLGHLFPVLIDPSGYNRRVRALAAAARVPGDEQRPLQRPLSQARLRAARAARLHLSRAHPAREPLGTGSVEPMKLYVC